MDRKNFIVASSLAAFSISVLGQMKASNEKFHGDCETTDDILGPFYRPNAPIRQDLLEGDVTGVEVTIKGRVFAADCSTPLKGAQVEIWHCNVKGAYDNDSEKFHQRARWFTDKKGNYAFTTILPGKYLNGKQYRPAHVHFRVTETSSRELVSQIYFKGDPHIEKDPWASQQKAELRVLPIILEDIKGSLTVNFDIYLPSK